MSDDRPDVSDLSKPEHRSWIVEIRKRLAEPPPRVVDVSSLASHGAGTGGNGGKGEEPRRAAALVPLYVDADNLWTVITERAQRVPGHSSPPAFPGALLEEDEEPWAAALRGGELEAGLPPAVTLDLGRLDETVTPAGVIITPCVGALPEGAIARRDDPAPEAAVTEVVPLPLSVLAKPRMVERRPVEIDGRQGEITVLHVGQRRIWGITASVIANLLVRLGLVEPE